MGGGNREFCVQKARLRRIHGDSPIQALSIRKVVFESFMESYLGGVWSRLPRQVHSVVLLRTPPLNAAEHVRKQSSEIAGAWASYVSLFRGLLISDRSYSEWNVAKQ